MALIIINVIGLSDFYFLEANQANSAAVCKAYRFSSLLFSDENQASLLPWVNSHGEEVSLTRPCQTMKIAVVGNEVSDISFPAANRNNIIIVNAVIKFRTGSGIRDQTTVVLYVL